jgi:hypothetical protein
MSLGVNGVTVLPNNDTRTQVAGVSAPTLVSTATGKDAQGGAVAGVSDLGVLAEAACETGGNADHVLASTTARRCARWRHAPEHTARLFAYL